MTGEAETAFPYALKELAEANLPSQESQEELKLKLLSLPPKNVQKPMQVGAYPSSVPCTTGEVETAFPCFHALFSVACLAMLQWTTGQAFVLLVCYCSPALMTVLLRLVQI